jgi:hypothetical protein
MAAIGIAGRHSASRAVVNGNRDIHFGFRPIPEAANE